MRVPQVWAAIDSGLVINPDGLKNQTEGGIIQSASWTPHEQVRFDKNGITVARLGELSDHDHAGGAEGRRSSSINRTERAGRSARARARRGRRWRRSPTRSRTATGKRIRDLPFTPDRAVALA